MFAASLKASRFFLGYLPSFTQLGYQCRRLGWQKTTWDFTGQRWLVTGASTGIGREIAESAARAGAHVIAVARNADRLEDLVQSTAGTAGTITSLALDLSLPTNVREVIDAVTALDQPLDVLVNNAGVLLDEPEITADGLDLGFATNLLAPFHVTNQLNAGRLLSKNATVINMSSGGMYSVPLKLSELDKQHNYRGVMAYAYQKRAQVALNAYWRRHSTGCQAYYVTHPGWVDTPGVEQSLPTFRLLLGPVLRTPTAGADTTLWLAQTRPTQDRDDRIWFDRALAPAHVLSGTRRGDSAEDLVRYLEHTLERL